MPSNLEETYATLATIFWWILVGIALIGGFVLGFLLGLLF